MPTIREHILHALGSSVDWVPGSSRLFKDTRYTTHDRVDDYRMKYIDINRSAFSDKGVDHLSSAAGDQLAVHLHEYLTHNGFEPHGSVEIFRHVVTFQVRTLCPVE